MGSHGWSQMSGHILFSDRGGEYISKALDSWCKTKGISHQYSVTADKPQNGRAERLNQTLNNMMRAMIYQYNSYKPLWGHAIAYAVLIKNMSYSSKLEMTPFQAFLHRIPDVSHFKTFGCRVIA